MRFSLASVKSYRFRDIVELNICGIKECVFSLCRKLLGKARKKGYDVASLRRGRLETGPTKAFEAPFVNDLWMTDFSPGPKLNIDGKVLTTHLCLILDDHSRLIVYGAYYLTADSYAFHHTLKQAVQRRGIPYKLYTDQGKPFYDGDIGRQVIAHHFCSHKERYAVRHLRHQPI
jgi:hypothetical protein